MKLSIIIVNYNVERFLEQCLHSVYRALQGIEAEVFVVDNASVDGSVAMVQERFPQVKLLINQENVGFSKANNQAIEQSTGEYVLLLNPDTVVEENTFRQCLQHMELHPECGGLGVYMVDGKGRFLPESKRGLPTPAAAFFKISGLYRFFPHSPRINRYYMGQLDPKENGEIEILAGAFMWMRKKALNEVGLLDETFFMYGEDIDLSYRILQGGYTNRYLADARIIHYKGESTKKGSLNYVYVFYQAMAIFARKHFQSGSMRLFLAIIQLAIGLRASLSVFKRLLDKGHLIAFDAGMLYGGMYLLKTYWEQNHRFVSGGGYPPEYMLWAVPGYILIWMLSAALSGGYDRPIRLGNMQRGLVVGSLLILAMYGLLNEEWRFSRALIVLGSLWSLLSMSLLRIGLHVLKGGYLQLASREKRCWLLGTQEGVKRLDQRLQQLRPQVQVVGNSIFNQGGMQSERLRDLIRIFKLDELIFDAQSIPTHEILRVMTQLSGTGVEIKIAPPDSLFIIGSNSIHQQGDWYSMGRHALDDSVHQRNKRINDLVLAVLIIVLWPFLVGFKRSAMLINNAGQVLMGKKTWVGFQSRPTPSGGKLRQAVVHPADAVENPPVETELLERLDLLYARDYSSWSDWEILWKAFTNTRH